MPRQHDRATSRSRRRTLLAGALLAASTSLSPLLVDTAADADDRLHQRGEENADRLRGARRDYDAASEAFLRTQAALQRAKDQLEEARSTLRTRREELAAAQAAHQRAERDLTAATARLDAARDQLETSLERIDAVQLEWKQQVVNEYETGGAALGALSTILNGTDPAGLMEHLAGLDAVNASYDATVSRTAAALALQEALEKELSAARADVRARALEAQQWLRRIGRAESAAEAARDSIQVLVDRRRDAAAAAAAVRARDAAQLRRLQEEQARIERILRRRAAAAEADEPVVSHRQPMKGGGWPWPVQGWVSTPFGWRTHPIYGYRSFHNGIDVAAACGTPVRAPAAGTVLAAYFQSAYGNRVLIDHGALAGVGTATEYNHLDRWAVAPGQRVTTGQIVGYVGNTGWSTGCHLHLTIYRSAEPVDPLTLPT